MLLSTGHKPVLNLYRFRSLIGLVLPDRSLTGSAFTLSWRVNFSPSWILNVYSHCFGKCNWPLLIVHWCCGCSHRRLMNGWMELIIWMQNRDLTPFMDYDHEGHQLYGILLFVVKELEKPLQSFDTESVRAFMVGSRSSVMIV